jgi:hypothetical protein
MGRGAATTTIFRNLHGTGLVFGPSLLGEAILSLQRLFFPSVLTFRGCFVTPGAIRRLFRHPKCLWRLFFPSVLASGGYFVALGASVLASGGYFIAPGCLWRLFFCPSLCLLPHRLRPPPPPRHVPTPPPTPRLQGVALGVCLRGYICGWGGLLEVPSRDLVKLENHYPLIYAIWHNFTWQGETLICPRSHNGA